MPAVITSGLDRKLGPIDASQPNIAYGVTEGYIACHLPRYLAPQRGTETNGKSAVVIRSSHYHHRCSTTHMWIMVPVGAHELCLRAFPWLPILSCRRSVKQVLYRQFCTSVPVRFIYPTPSHHFRLPSLLDISYTFAGVHRQVHRVNALLPHCRRLDARSPTCEPENGVLQEWKILSASIHIDVLRTSDGCLLFIFFKAHKCSKWLRHNITIDIDRQCAQYRQHDGTHWSDIGRTVASVIRTIGDADGSRVGFHGNKWSREQRGPIF